MRLAHKPDGHSPPAAGGGTAEGSWLLCHSLPCSMDIERLRGWVGTPAQGATVFQDNTIHQRVIVVWLE
ncbi:MAG: hypothetical protein MUC60_18235 [Oscillatoria sp. Prado101]|nr:hypothetical protein [Oscillatoria sp. Prado101]